MKKCLFFLCVLFLMGRTFAQGEIGIDIGQPIDPATGAINPGADTAVVGATCALWVRVNFILGPWSSPSDLTLYNGRTWKQTYDEIINGLVAKGIKVYALIGTEAYTYPKDTLEQYPGADSASAVSWIENYTTNFVQIVDMFKDRVRVFESFNEPNNWTNSNTPIVHAAWFSLLLQNIYLNVKYFAGHNMDPAWQVTLVSGALFTFDLNSGGQYINDTYWYGKNVFAWDWTHQNAGSYPLDGFGQHIYVAQGDSDITNVTNAINANLDDFWNNIYVYETDPAKKIWISEFGWETNVYGESFQAGNLNTGFTVFQADARVALSLWFTLSDFPGGDWGIYYMGNYLPSEQKQSYTTFKSRNNCAGNTTAAGNNNNFHDIAYITRDKESYFLIWRSISENTAQLELTDVSGQRLKSTDVVLHNGETRIQLDVSELAHGMYLLRATSGYSQKIFKVMVD